MTLLSDLWAWEFGSGTHWLNDFDKLDPFIRGGGGGGQSDNIGQVLTNTHNCCPEEGGGSSYFVLSDRQP